MGVTVSLQLNELFQEVLGLFPELKEYNVVLEVFESKPGFSIGRVFKRDNLFVVRIATNMISDEIHASFVIAHELAHILINPHDIPSEDEKWEPRDLIEMFDKAIEDVVCDWIALKRLEHYYSRDRERLRRLYEVYLGAVGVEGYVALAEDLKHRLAEAIKEKYSEHIMELLTRYFMGIPLENLEMMSLFTILAISKYLKLHSIQL